MIAEVKLDPHKKQRWEVENDEFTVYIFEHFPLIKIITNHEKKKSIFIFKISITNILS